MHYTLFEGQQLFIVGCTAADRCTEATRPRVLHLERPRSAGGDGQAQGKGMLAGVHITNRADARAVLQHRFTASIKNARVHVGVDDWIASRIVDGSTEHVTAGTFGAGDVGASAETACAGLGSRVRGVAWHQGDGIETQVGCPGRWGDQKKRSDQQRGEASHNSNQAWFLDAIRVWSDQ